MSANEGMEDVFLWICGYCEGRFTTEEALIEHIAKLGNHVGEKHIEQSDPRRLQFHADGQKIATLEDIVVALEKRIVALEKRSRHAS